MAARQYIGHAFFNDRALAVIYKTSQGYVLYVDKYKKMRPILGGHAFQWSEFAHRDTVNLGYAIANEYHVAPKSIELHHKLEAILAEVNP